MKNQKLWQHNTSINTVVDHFTAGSDSLLDVHLIPYDIYGSLAHAQMLAKVKLITQEEWHQIQSSLVELHSAHQNGTFTLSPDDEDVHSRIENEVTTRFPHAGANMHIGRSRNDQVLTDIRLYSKDQLLQVADAITSITGAFLDKADQGKSTPMPGYTHMQPAMLSSVGAWLGQFAESLTDDLEVLKHAFEMNDQSPLGSGAAYGVALPIDREMTAEALGFAKVQNNALYCQNSRGKIESLTVHSLLQVMHTLGRFAADLLLFTGAEFRFFDLPDELTTGSSIMPQKRNFDVLELLRAKEKTMMAYEFQIASTICGLPSGYNRDLQELKQPYIAAFELVKESLLVTELVIKNLHVNARNIQQHIYPEMFAAHWAYQLMSEKNIPFRTAYFEVKEHIADIPHFNTAEVLSATKSQGAAGNLQLALSQDTLKENITYWHVQHQHFTKHITQLLKLS